MSPRTACPQCVLLYRVKNQATIKLLGSLQCDQCLDWAILIAARVLYLQLGILLNLCFTH